MCNSLERWPNFDLFLQSTSLYYANIDVFVMETYRNTFIQIPCNSVDLEKAGINNLMVKIINFNVTFDSSINYFECHKYAYTICNTKYFCLNQDKVLFILYNVRAHQ